MIAPKPPAKVHVLLCGNPSAKSGDAAAEIARAKDALTARGCEVTVLHTVAAGGTPALVTARVNAGGIDVAAALGGDGTFADIGKGLLGADRRVPLGLVPFGTANDQAKSLGIPTESERADHVERAADIIAARHLTHLDVGEVKRLDGRKINASDVFFDSFGVGFQAEVLRLRNEDRKVVGHIPIVRDIYRDQAVYAGALLSSWVKSFQRPEKMRVEIVADGRTVVFDSLLDLVVKNTAIYGGAWVFARDSAPDDGLFEVVPFTNRRELFSKVLSDLSALPDLSEDLEALGVEHSKTFKAASLDIKVARVKIGRGGRERVATQIDGEEWVDGARFKINVLKGALDVITPGSFRPPWRAPT